MKKCSANWKQRTFAFKVKVVHPTDYKRWFTVCVGLFTVSLLLVE